MATRETPPPELLAALRAEADASGHVSWATFSRIALYHATAGYYRRNQQRVGKKDGADFYTSVSVGPVFGQLIATAARGLIEPEDASDFTLAEIGTEPSGGMFNGVETGFGQVKTFPIGTEFKPDKKTILVANEVLDAQPFHRLEFHQGRWQEWGVDVSGELLVEVPLNDLSMAVHEELLSALPDSSLEGYRLDLALEAETLVKRWATGDWHGGMILIDYGKWWDELIQVTPQGTARAYYRHQQETNLLARPSEQDLTTHVCWDRIQAALGSTGFTNLCVERQEAFLVKRAWSAIEKLSTEPGNRGPIQSLIHPSGFGAKFQVFSAKR